MKNFYKVNNTDVTNLCEDLRSLFYDITSNKKMVYPYSGKSIIFKEWDYVKENYPSLAAIASKIPLSEAISFFKGCDFLTHEHIYPHSHNTKYSWSLLWGLENCDENITTQFFIEKDNSIPEVVAYYMKDSNHTNEKTFQRNILTKSIDELQFIDKFSLLNNEVFLFNVNTYHFPIDEGSGYNINNDRMVCHWYIKSDDIESFKSVLSL